MTQDFDAAIAAIHNRDPARLDAAFSSAEEAAKFRDEVLHTLPADACRWFWEQTFDEGQLQRVAGAVIDVAAATARQGGFTLGVDYSVGVDDAGLAQLIATAAVFRHVMERLPAQRRSVLKGLVNVPAD